MLTCFILINRTPACISFIMPQLHFINKPSLKIIRIEECMTYTFSYALLCLYLLIYVCILIHSASWFLHALGAIQYLTCIFRPLMLPLNISRNLSAPDQTTVIPLSYIFNINLKHLDIREKCRVIFKFELVFKCYVNIYAENVKHTQVMNNYVMQLQLLRSIQIMHITSA